MSAAEGKTAGSERTCGDGQIHDDVHGFFRNRSISYVDGADGVHALRLVSPRRLVVTEPGTRTRRESCRQSISTNFLCKASLELRDAPGDVALRECKSRRSKERKRGATESAGRRQRERNARLTIRASLVLVSVEKGFGSAFVIRRL